MIQLTDDETVDIGIYCEAVLRDPSFNRLVELFNQTAFINFASTAPGQKDEREEAFAKYDGVRTFLAMMTDYAIEANKLTQPTDPNEDHNMPPSHMDAV